MKKFYFTVSILMLSLLAHSQYHQTFDSLVNTGTGLDSTLPAGWGIYEVGTGAAADGKYVVGTGSSNTGNAYSFGNASGDPERSLGTVASGSNFPTMGVIFFNETDEPITSVTISYTGEQWRYGGRATGTKDTLRFEYSLDANGIVNTTGSWVRVKPLDFLSPISSTTANTGIALDGNAAANRQVISYTITGLNLQGGQSIVLRWSDFDIASNDDGLAIDDFTISAGLAPGVMSSGGTKSGGGTGGGGGTVSNTSTSVPIFENKVAIDSGFITLYGNLHSHSTHSDGKPSSKEPIDDYNFAMQADGMDFLGVSEHNHATAGLQIANYHKGFYQAEQANGQLNKAGNPFVALHGMEWGTISGGGHVVVYGFIDSLIGWEDNNYDIFVQKSDYMNLFEKVRTHKDAIATLAHPNTTDFTGLTGGYKGVADSAVMSVAVESGPAFSTSTTYSDYPASLAYINYYKSLLKQGYRLGANMDQDNHEMTYGTANSNRMVVMAKDRSRESILDAIAHMRVYASNDYNASVSFTIGNYIMGSSIITSSDTLSIHVSHQDADGEAVSAIQLYGGQVGGADATLLYASAGSMEYARSQGLGQTWYYYAVVTQMDGNKIVTSPIWVTEPGLILPIVLTDFKGVLTSGNALLSWNTASEVNASHFIVERLNSGKFVEIGKVNATGIGTYSFTDNNPIEGLNYYRLKQVDKDGKVEYSRVISVNLESENTIFISPNPTRGIVRINTKSIAGQKVLVQVIDAAGNMVHNQTYDGGSPITLNLSKLAGGTYVIRVNDKIRQLVISK